jgi:hypothetical protein
MKPNEEVEVDFDNQNDKFVTGNIFEEVGIDVLNLKELGLDVGFVI